MKSQGHSRVFQLIFPVVVVLMLGSLHPTAAQDDTHAASLEACDWQYGDLHKMHWPQLPDLSPTGIDVSLSQIILADDFMCTASGPIRDIHIWGSFADDILPKEGPEGLTFELSLYSDIPAEKDRWSRPGEALWRKTFKPGEYTARRVHDGPEGWYDLLTNLYLPDNHRWTFQYNFCIEEEPFVQEEGTVYWLAVRELSENLNYRFGWKTTSRRYRWNDDATYLYGADMGWVEMTYPKEHEYAEETLDLAFVITSGDEAPPEHDLGDAPDSSNSFPGATMLAYPSGVLGHFPTVYQAGSPPYGPMHQLPRDMYYLGRAVSLESEADLGPDEDATNNLDPLNDSANRDGADDGLHLPVVMPHCQETTLEYTVTVLPSTVTPTDRMYVNVWCDWNRDGDWDDLLLCADGTRLPEWAVQNQHLALPPGTHVVATPPFRCWHPSTEGDLDPIWVRITIAEQLHLPSVLIPGTAPGIEGAGPGDGYRYGETEDYYLRPLKEPPATRLDWGDAPDSAALPGYPTSMANDGARHVIGGPWLGDENDKPDPEADGQPDLHALGDDSNGSSDENGASVPPLIQGQLAAVTVQVTGGGVVQAWIDFDGNKAWEDSEQIVDGFLPDGVHVIPFAVPDDATPGQSFARFRISTRGGLDPVGPAADGEVEDHQVWIRVVPQNMKWHQWPDLTPRGIDIRVDRSDDRLRALADDFECRMPSLLTHVRFWGSWKDDHKGEIKKIRLRIYPDDPVGPEGADQRNLFSKPRPEILWEKEFRADEFREALYHVVYLGGEWWWDPASGESTPGGDTQVWQIDITIDPNEAFLQSGSSGDPRIYWLAIETETADGEFGWKTRQWPEHFMDDAVWDVKDKETTPASWDELRYPLGHRYHDHERNSVDLAFCLMFTPEVPEPATCRTQCITTCPPTETTCPAFLTQCPTLETQCPADKTRCPAMKTKCPLAETRCPMARTKCPPILTLCPAELTKCLGEITTCPPLQTRCPTLETTCPAEHTKCPLTATLCHPTDTQCPAILTSCPVAETRCPPTVTKCLGADTQCPAVETKCPPLETTCPAEHTKCPLTATLCHPTDTQCPAILTSCPVAETRCPPTVTKCLGGDTQCPTVETKCPPLETKCPVFATRCPTKSTECPVAATQCPATETRCSGPLTKCVQCILLGSSQGPADVQRSLPGWACPVVEADCLTVSQYLAMAGTTK